ncbi:MAG: hypothetical protein LQ348_007176 [Seirophora lacunosa]|nr:MAG: hypothetical protein LQ348_007176 [Seirophora lacunosa]
MASAQELTGTVVDPLDFPLASPPPGAVQNLANPESRAYQIYAISAVFLALTISFLLIRLYAKLYIQRSRTWDDSVISYTGVIITVVSEPGGAKHLWDTTIGDFSDKGFIEELVVVALYGPVIFLVKLALFLLYLHLFGRLRWLRWLVWLGILVTGCFYVSGPIVVFTLCAPSRGDSWLGMSFKSKCRNGLQDYGVAQGTINLLSDFYLLVVPIPAVLALQLPKKKKIGVIAIFMTGFLACIVSTVALGLRITYNKTADITWNVITLYIMTIVEMNVGLMVACMPSIATVFRHHADSIGSLLGRISSKLRSLSSRRDTASYSRRGGGGGAAEKSRYSPESSVGGGGSSSSSRPRSSRTYVELRDMNIAVDRSLAPAAVA